MIKELVLKNRTYRKFDSSFIIEDQLLIELVELARISNSARNAQTLKFIIVNNEMKDEVFSTLKWAGALTDWDGPTPEERPSSYIIICNDESLNYYNAIDVGIMTQSILLGAVEQGLGACQFGAFSKSRVSEILDLEDHLKPVSILAIGKPTEVIKLVDVKDGVSYYRKDGVHYVPKRSLEDILIKK